MCASTGTTRPPTAPPSHGVDRIYLVAPVMRTDFADQVSSFLDLAEAAGVRHVTYLSAYGIDQAPPQVAHAGRRARSHRPRRLTHSILRPAWFMQNFSETFLKPVDGAIAVPTGDGAEAFVDAEDIAAVAAATLADPDAHAGAAVRTDRSRGAHGERGRRASSATSPASRSSTTTSTATNGSTARVAAGVPAEYGEMLRMLTETIASGHGSRPNNDVEKVTGAPPTSFADFARRTARGLGRRRTTMTADQQPRRLPGAGPVLSDHRERALAGLADGEHFFDLLAEDVVFDYIITIPATRGTSKAARPSPSCIAPTATPSSSIAAYDLAVHHDPKTGVVVLEYASQGRVVRDRSRLHQPLHLGAHDHRPQGRSLARLPRPGRGLRRDRMALALETSSATLGSHSRRCGQRNVLVFRRRCRGVS